MNARRRRYDDRIGVRDVGDRFTGYDDRDYLRGSGGFGEGGGYREGGGLADQASGKASEFAQTIRDKATDVVHEAADAARGLGDKADDVMQRAGDAAGRARSRVHEAGHVVGDRVSEYAHRAADRGRRVEGDAGRFFDENPLVVGAAMMAVGAAIGMAIPITRKESEFLGEYRDDAVGRAKRLASGALGKVEQAAQRVADDLSKGGGDKGGSRGRDEGAVNRERGEFARDAAAVADRTKSAMSGGGYERGDIGRGAAGGGDLYRGGSTSAAGYRDTYERDVSGPSTVPNKTPAPSGGPGSTTGADKGLGSLGSGTTGATSPGIGAGSTPYGGGQKIGGTPFSAGEPPIPNRSQK
jgi:ElaB/YqjD/DUF883 family membrane-anchored ribosome-binding protein